MCRELERNRQSDRKTLDRPEWCRRHTWLGFAAVEWLRSSCAAHCLIAAKGTKRFCHSSGCRRGREGLLVAGFVRERCARRCLRYSITVPSNRPNHRPSHPERHFFAVHGAQAATKFRCTSKSGAACVFYITISYIKLSEIISWQAQPAINNHAACFGASR